MAHKAAEALKALEDLESQQSLFIISLSDSIAFPDGADESGTTRSSDVSADNSGFTETSPAAMRAELAHYKVMMLPFGPYLSANNFQDMFSKLRFSYIEQVTKEKFLRAITSDTPTFVEPHENAELEAKLLEEKAGLKAQKDEVARMIEELEVRGRDLARRYEAITLQRAQLSELPERISNLQEQIDELRQSHPSPQKSTNPSLNLPLPETMKLVAERETQLASLNSQISVLQASLPRKTREVERLEAELGPLMNQKRAVVAQAMEARRLREEGGVDSLEERGRWYKASEEVLRKLLDVEG
jgi:DNA repair exonuclease SbcCD ATPase subunit